MQSNTTSLASFERPSRKPELRRGARTWTDLPVHVLVNGFSHACRVIDISSTGMVVELCRDLAIKEPQQLGNYAVHLGAMETLNIKARTIWQRGTQRAVRFVAQYERELMAIAGPVGLALRRIAGDVERLELAEQMDRRAHQASAHPTRH